jgi:tetratricopeptide (TPR) repeat protein
MFDSVISGWASAILAAITVGGAAAATRGWKKGWRLQTPIRRAGVGSAAEREANLAEIAYTDNRVADAAEHWRRAAKAAERAGNAAGVGNALMRGVAVLAELRRWDEALAQVERVLRNARARLDADLETRAFHARVSLLVSAGRPKEAIREARAAAARARRRVWGEHAEQPVLELLLDATGQLTPAELRADAAQLRDDINRLWELSANGYGRATDNVTAAALDQLQKLCRLTGDEAAALAYGHERIAASVGRLGQ